MECNKIYEEYKTIHIAQPFPAGNPEGGIDFTVRGLTSRETAAALVEAGINETRTIVTLRASDHKAVYFGLGGATKLGQEGWKHDKELTLEAVENMRDEAVAALASAVIALTYPTAEQIKNSGGQ